MGLSDLSRRLPEQGKVLASVLVSSLLKSERPPRLPQGIIEVGVLTKPQSHSDPTKPGRKPLCHCQGYLSRPER